MSVHFGLSAVYGLVFAWLARGATTGLAWAGAAFGFGLYVLNIVIVPALFAGWAGHMAPPDGAGHLLSGAERVLFGAVLGAAYRAWRRTAAA